MPDDPVVVPPVVTPPPAPWYQGVDEETTGWIQNRGLDKLDPIAAAKETIKGHREAEKLLGVPRDELVRIPKNRDEASMKLVYEKLGAPADGKYDFTAVKFADGTDLDKGFVDAMTAAANAAHLPKDAAAMVTAAVVKHLDGTAAEKAAVQSAAVVEEKAALKQSWGNSHDQNMVVARAGAEKLGVTPEQVAALEKTVGYAGIMEMFRKVGALGGEGTFRGGNVNAPGVMTREQAVAKKGELMRDPLWSKRYSEGGAAENREMRALLEIETGESFADQRPY